MFVLTLHPPPFGQICHKDQGFLSCLKFGTGVTCYILISNLIFIFSEFLSFIFFWTNLVQNLKFSKLIEIWYGGTFLYAYHDFKVHFFKSLFIHIFWANLVPKTEVLHINSYLVQGYIAICLLGF